MLTRRCAVGAVVAMLLSPLALAGFSASGNAPSSPPQDYGLLPWKTDSDERWAPINALKRQAPQLARALVPGVHVSRDGQRLPYRLFTPTHLDPGQLYALVVFLHGASGSGTDNVKQLEGGNLYGSLVWALPENQGRHPAFVLASMSRATRWAVPAPGT